MRVTAFFHGIFFKNQIVLRCTDNKDFLLIKRLFDNKKERESRTKKEILLKCEIDAQYQKRTFKQLAAVWKLIEIIFESMEDRKPTEEEKYDLYLDLLEVYADKVPSKIKVNNLRSVHISESNTLAAAHFIDGLLYHLCTECQLKNDLQADVRKVIYEWEIWRGKQDEDINDYRTISDMRKRVTYSEASGRTPVDFHHIVSRGAFPGGVNCAWNILALTHDEHMEFHDKGWGYFLNKYPHLEGKVRRAFKKSGHGDIPEVFMKEPEKSNTANLVMLALEE